MFASVSAIVLCSVALAAVPAKAKIDSEAWPVVGGSDFKLAADLVARGEKDDKGVLHLANNTLLSVRLKAEKDCDVAVYWVDPKGQVVQLFPNRFDRANRLKAGEERVIPAPNKDYELVAVPTVGTGFDRLHIVAVTGNLPALPKGEVQGPFIAFRSESDRKDVIRAVRGVVVREKPSPGVKGDVQVAQAELKFRVQP